MKEGLIEIFHKLNYQNRPNGMTANLATQFTEYALEQIVDKLLSEGVIVSPVKLGSRHKVYIPIKSTNAVLETKVYGIGVDEDGDMVINPTEYPKEAISIIGCYIGKTVFLTREEAEQALKGANNEQN